MANRKLRPVLLLMAVASAAAFLIAAWRYQPTPPADPAALKVGVGVTKDLFFYLSREEGRDAFRAGLQVTPLSGVFLALAVGSFWSYRRSRKAPPDGAGPLSKP